MDFVRCLSCGNSQQQACQGLAEDCAGAFELSTEVPSTEPSESLSAVLSQVYLPPNALSEIGELTTDAILEVSGCSSSSQLKSLDLSSLNLSSFALTFRLDPGVFACLTSLDISHNQVRDISAVAACVALESLCMQQNSVRSLAPVAGLAQLRELNAAQNHLENLAGLELLRQLTKLDVRNNRLQSFPETVQTLQALDSLAVLDIDYTTCFMKTPRAFDFLAYSVTVQVLNGTDLTNYTAEMDPVFLCRLAILNKGWRPQSGLSQTLREIRHLCPTAADFSQVSRSLSDRAVEKFMAVVVQEISELRRENAQLRSHLPG